MGNSRPRYYSAMSPLNAPKDPNLLKNVEKFPSGRGYPTERLPTLKLKNEVIWTNQNKNLKSPFHLKKSQKDVDLGIFLKTNEYTTSEGDHALGVRWSHGRSADIGKVFFRDLSRPDLVYRDIDIKGAGYVTGSISPLGERLISKQWGPRKSEFGEYLGLLNKKAALHDSVMSEILTQKGVRTHRSLAVIKLHELPVLKDGKLEITSVDELLKNRLLRPDFEPVIQVRAYGIKARLADFLLQNASMNMNNNRMQGDMENNIKNEINDAISLIQYETRGSVKDALDYLRWFAITLGNNIRLLRTSGYAHGYANSQNITLDCCLVDLDSVSTTNQQHVDEKSLDYLDAAKALKHFCADILSLYGHESSGEFSTRFKKELDEIYRAAFHSNLHR